MKKTIIILLAIAAIAGLAVFIQKKSAMMKTTAASLNQESQENAPQNEGSENENSVSTSSPAKQTKIDEAKKLELLKAKPYDIVLGDQNAPITMVEYASLSCPHCSAFSREAFDKLKSDYISSGKMKFIYRDFPLNHQAFVPAMFALCQAKNSPSNKSEKYYATVKALFRTQDSWAFDQKYIDKLRSIAQLDGMSAEKFDECINDKNLQQQILKQRMEAAEVRQLKSTPSFFINGEELDGYVDYPTLQKAIERKLSEKSAIKK